MAADTGLDAAVLDNTAHQCVTLDKHLNPSLSGPVSNLRLVTVPDSWGGCEQQWGQ